MQKINWFCIYCYLLYAIYLSESEDPGMRIATASMPFSRSIAQDTYPHSVIAKPVRKLVVAIRSPSPLRSSGR